MAIAQRILGIDPGYDRCGFGVVEKYGMDATWVYHGCLQTSAKQMLTERLQLIRDEMRRMIEVYQPACIAIEKLYFQKNVTMALDVGMARGILLVTAADAGVPIVELAPTQVKQGMTGYGSADKKQVQMMVQKFLKLKDLPKPDDAADALAIAIVGGLLFRSE